MIDFAVLQCYRDQSNQAISAHLVERAKPKRSNFNLVELTLQHPAVPKGCLKLNLFSISLNVKFRLFRSRSCRTNFHVPRLGSIFETFIGFRKNRQFLDPGFDSFSLQSIFQRRSNFPIRGVQLILIKLYFIEY